MNSYILIEYSNSVDFGDIVYHNTFANKVYLDADVSKPEYELVEEGIENDEGEFDPTFQKWAKKYSIRFYAQEFLVDALTLMALHDQINITLKNGEASNVLDVEVTPKWDADIECWAEVTIKFTTDYILRKGCDVNMTVGCTSPVVVAALAPQDADDGAGGEDYWDGTDPVSQGTIMFFCTVDSGSDFSGDPLGFYRYSTADGWVLIDMESGQFGETTAATDYIYLIKSTYYIAAPYISTIDDLGGGDAKIYALSYGIENNFFQVQYDNGGWTDLGDPALASAFHGGYTVSPGVGNWDFRLKWYTHSCDYGTGNEKNKTIT